MRRTILVVGVALVAALTTPALAGAQNAAPGCSAARPYAIYVSVNEALFIGGSHGFKITGSGSDDCFVEATRTYVHWFYNGRNYGGYGDVEQVRMEAYVYGSQAAGYNLGDVSWRWLSPAPPYDTTGTYVTPNE